MNIAEKLEQNQKKLRTIASVLNSKCPEFASILLFAPRVAVIGDFICKTDGKIIKVGEKFFEQSFSYQVYKLFHICLHLGLRHHHRAYEIKNNPIAMKLWEIATDAIINTSLQSYVESLINGSTKEQISFDRDEKIITINKIKDVLEKLGLDLNEPKNLMAEKLYITLLRGVEGKEINMSELPEVEESDLEGQQFDISAQVLKDNGLVEEMSDSNKSSLSDALWGNRIRDAFKQHGKLKGSALMGLLEHLYKPKINWQAILRSFLNSRLKPEKEADYSRPNRRNLAGVIQHFEPNRTKKRGIKTLAVCLDTSGSCWNSQTISKFVSNIDVVHRETGSELIVIIFDWEVHEVFTVKQNESLSKLINDKKVEITGGGGTSFIEPMNKALEYNPDVIAVFTDCYGPFGDMPKVPVIWASIGDSAPWGKIIIIDEEV